jgi:hypothetical protein
MSSPKRFTNYGGSKFFFKKFEGLESFQEQGKKAVEKLLRTRPNDLKRFEYFKNIMNAASFSTKKEKKVGTDFATADKGEFIDYFKKKELKQAIESFDAILGEIEMGGEIKKSKLIITDDKRGIFDFGLASKGLFRVVEFFSEELKNELPEEFKDLPKGIVQPDLVQKNILGQFVYVSETNKKSYFLKRRQKGTTQILNLKPDALLKVTDNGIEYTTINNYQGVKLEFASSTKKSYLMFEKKGGKARYVDLYCVIGGAEELTAIGMLNRTLPILLAAKVLEENGIKTRIFGMRMYQQTFGDEEVIIKGKKVEVPKLEDGFINYTFQLKDYSQDIDFNWLAINVADPRFFRWNLWKYTSALLQLDGEDDSGFGVTVYEGNKLNEVFGRYKNWYFAEMEAGREPENRLDKRLMISGGFSPKNKIEKDKIKEEFNRILDVVDFQFNTPEKAVQKIYNRYETEDPYSSKSVIRFRVRSYIIRILGDAYSYPAYGQYATSMNEQNELDRAFEDTIEAVSNYLNLL